MSNVDSNNLAYCNECEDLVEFDIVEENISEVFKGKEIEYIFNIGRCKCCGSEVATDIDYNCRKSDAKFKALCDKYNYHIIEPFNFASILMEMDKTVLEEIFNVKLVSNEDLFKKFSYEEALKIYNKWRGIKK